MRSLLSILVTLALLNLSSPGPPAGGLPQGVARWARSGQYVEIDGLKIHYLVSGRGNPIVLIHGLGGNIFSWRGNISALAQEHQVWALDLPGFGSSDKPGNWDYSLAHQAQFVNDFLQHFGITQATVIGNSMGGGIALELAARFPERVARLVLIDSVAYLQVKIPFWADWLSRTPLAWPLSKFFTPRFGALKKILQGLYAQPDRVSDEVTWGYYYPLSMPGHLQASLAMLRTLRFSISPQRLRQIRQPALLIWGARDRLIPPSQGVRLAHDLPRARLVLVPDAGHMPNEERPQVVNRLIGQFSRLAKP